MALNKPWDEATDKIEAKQNGIDVTAPDWQVKWRTLAISRIGETHAKSFNPILPWVGLRLAMDSELPVPDWVLRYFYESAGLLNQMIREGKHRGRKEAESVGRMLGFGADGKGQTSAFRDITLQDRDVKIAIHVVCGMVANGWSQEKSVGEVAGTQKLSEATVERAYARYRDVAQSRVSNFIDK
ncbi:hypothetical protein [Mesorhizobium sp. B2-3-15]|uniref:hypothetical protein n=1 Tax=Mesorhizobium sp. B2-3-15 TaxID=2589949 RepID=UPI00112BA5A0|nr:hypothetical protein [Mesorhizobium sp. B2-3-15]TPL75111.1 hypothetical protein FJ954_09135 [Mesorhizobium sp. B2-3-15]